MVIAFPAEYVSKTMTLLIDDGLVYAKTNAQAHIVINNKETIRLIKRKGFVVVNA